MTSEYVLTSDDIDELCASLKKSLSEGRDVFLSPPEAAAFLQLLGAWRGDDDNAVGDDAVGDDDAYAALMHTELHRLRTAHVNITSDTRAKINALAYSQLNMKNPRELVLLAVSLLTQAEAWPGAFIGSECDPFGDDVDEESIANFVDAQREAITTVWDMSREPLIEAIMQHRNDAQRRSEDEYIMFTYAGGRVN